MNINVSLPNELVAFVEARVETGRYGSSSDVVREALRLMERLERRNAEKLTDLRAAWQEGLSSGGAEELDLDALKAEGRLTLAASKA